MALVSRFSPDSRARSEIEQLASDLRRQREDLRRHKAQASLSAETTAKIVQKIEELRERSKVLQARHADPER